ncbi:hypothetical protein ACH4TC_32055 [Streptomyces spororaveus]|uniref:hypothetical protein n=1 Tax=Streptomyces spororaveus TaxID=284039 RepID=UPI0037A914B9
MVLEFQVLVHRLLVEPELEPPPVRPGFNRDAQRLEVLQCPRRPRRDFGARDEGRRSFRRAVLGLDRLIDDHGTPLVVAQGTQPTRIRPAQPIGFSQTCSLRATVALEPTGERVVRPPDADSAGVADVVGVLEVGEVCVRLGDGFGVRLLLLVFGERPPMKQAVVGRQRDSDGMKIVSGP